MKKFNVKSFMIGFLITMTLSVAYSVNAETINAILNDVYIYIVNQDGTSKYIDAPNILYNDRTYVPLRAISEELGYNVEYDEKTNSAIIRDYVPQKDNKLSVNVNTNNSEKLGVNAKYVFDNPQYLIDLTGISLTAEDNKYGSPTLYATNCTKDKIIIEIYVKMQNYTTNKYVFGDGTGVVWGNERYGIMFPDLPEYDLYYRQSIYTVMPGLNNISQFETDDIYITEIGITFVNDMVEKRKGTIDYFVEETIKYDFTADNIVGVSLGERNVEQ